MDRRDFMRLTAGGVALSTLPLTACTTEGASPTQHDGALAVAPDGTLFELEPNQHRIRITVPGRDPLHTGRLGRARGQLNYPVALAVLGELAYVVDLGNHRVQAFDRDGVCQAVLGEGELSYPAGIAVRGDHLIVADTGNHRLVELSPNGRVVRRIGEGALSAPRGVAVIDDHLLVANTGTRQVVELDADGAIVRTFDGDWVLPCGVASDGDVVYVADASRNELAVFDRDGARTDTLSLQAAPSYVTLSDDGALFVG